MRLGVVSGPPRRDLRGGNLHITWRIIAVAEAFATALSQLNSGKTFLIYATLSRETVIIN